MEKLFLPPLCRLFGVVLVGRERERERERDRRIDYPEIVRYIAKKNNPFGYLLHSELENGPFIEDF